jgi:hypothetical protein
MSPSAANEPSVLPKERRHELNNSYQATGIVNGKRELVRPRWLVKQYALESEGHAY